MIKLLTRSIALLIGIFFYHIASSYAQSLTPVWVDALSGSGNCQPSGMAVDPQNNVYITGIFTATADLDPSPNTVSNVTTNGGFDVFIAKYKPDGKLIWARSVGGSGLDQANSLAVDKNGNVTITGQTRSPRFDADPGPGGFALNNNGDEDIFTIQLNTDGNFVWANSIGGAGADRGGDITTDDAGNVTIACQFQQVITVGSNVYTTTAAFSALVVKYNAIGQILWSVNLGETGDNEARGIATDASNNIIVSGPCSGTVNFNPLGTPVLGANNSDGTFLAKYDPSGALIWVRQIKGSLVTNLSNICVDKQGDICISGSFVNTLSFDAKTTLAPRGLQDVMIARYSSSGDLQWAKGVGGISGNAFCYRIVADAANNIFFTGYYTGTIDFNADPTVTNNLRYHGARDFFVAKYDVAGNYNWAFSYGSSSCVSTFGIELAIDHDDNILLSGTFCGVVNFDANQCAAFNLTAKSPIADTYIVKYDQDAPVLDASTISSFVIPQQIAEAVIDPVNFKITVNVPAVTDRSALRPAITATAGGIVTPASGVVQSFVSPVSYNVAKPNSCGIVTYSVNVLLNAALSVCSGETTTLTGKLLNNTSASYTWEMLQNNSWIAAPAENNKSDHQVTAPNNVTGVVMLYYYRRKVTIGSGITYDSYYDLNVQPSTEQNVITADRLIFCPEDTNPLVFTGNKPVGYNSNTAYTWQKSYDAIAWTTMANSTEQDLKYLPPDLKIFYIRRITTIANCQAVSNVVRIEAAPTLSVSVAGTEQVACQLVRATLNANVPKPNEIGVWSVVSPAGYNPFNSTNMNDPAATISNIPEDVDVMLKWTIYTTLCTQVSEAYVKVRNNSVPIISAGTDKVIALGGRVKLESTIKTVGSYRIEWNPMKGLDNPMIANPVASPEANTTYTLKVTNLAGCVSESKVKVVVETDVIVPNTFTPNGDGVNDRWEIAALKSFPKLEIWVYTRWGKPVYYARNYDTPWDGTFEGRKVNPGVYYYVIWIEGLKKRKTGPLTIIN